MVIPGTTHHGAHKQTGLVGGGIKAQAAGYTIMCRHLPIDASIECICNVRETKGGHHFLSSTNGSFQVVRWTSPLICVFCSPHKIIEGAVCRNRWSEPSHVLLGLDLVGGTEQPLQAASNYFSSNSLDPQQLVNNEVPGMRRKVKYYSS